MPPLVPPDAELRRGAARGLLHLLLALLLLRAAVAPALTTSPPVGPPPRLDVDLARDPAWRLALLPGLGPVRARALVEDRRRQGPPRTPRDLLRVAGLGPATLAALLRAREVRVLLDGRPLEAR